MNIQNMNWMQIEAYLEKDDRAILPLGSTEQHAYLSLSVDSILAEKIASDAAEPLGIPVFPVLPYGLTPYFTAYAGSISLSMNTYNALITDILDNLKRMGFRRIVLVNGHGGNSSAGALGQEYTSLNPEVTVKLHNWWKAPKTWAKVQEIDPIASHASWMENFPWTRLEGIELPKEQKQPVDMNLLDALNPAEVRTLLGDGNFAGDYQKEDEIMHALWDVAVEETRSVLEGPWNL